MSAVRVLQSFLPFSWDGVGVGSDDRPHDEQSGRLLKRRKTRSSNFSWSHRHHQQCAMEMEDASSMSASSTVTSSATISGSEEFETSISILKEQLQQFHHHDDNSLAPNLFLSRLLADRGLPDRLDPLSIDHFMNFEGVGNGGLRETPAQLVMAIQQGDTRQLLSSKPKQAQSLRTPQGETLLHVACRFRQHAVVDHLLSVLRVPTLVLDQNGRTPLHSLFLAVSDAQHACYFEIMRQLLRHTPMLVMYTDGHGKTPLEYVNETSGSYLSQQVNTLLVQENVVEQVVQELSRQRQQAHAGNHMTAMEKVDRMVNLDGVNAAVLEAGFSI
jgi:hypothetical protein